MVSLTRYVDTDLYFGDGGLGNDYASVTERPCMSSFDASDLSDNSGAKVSMFAQRHPYRFIHRKLDAFQNRKPE